mgnify:FL=1
MDLALLTGQRPADVLKLTRADIRDGALHLKQNKTGKIWASLDMLRSYLGTKRGI